MAKLVVEVLDAADLMPKDGQGSANPFVEVNFDGQVQRTQTKTRDLYPSWNQTLVFNVQEPRKVQSSIIEVCVYNDRKPNETRNFLGRVRLTGAMVPESEAEASVQRYPLDKRGLFSNIRGDIALRIFLAHGQFSSDQPQVHEQQPQQHHQRHESAKHVPIVEQMMNTMNTDAFAFQDEYNKFEEVKEKQHNNNKEKQKQKEVRTFFSVGAGGGGGGPGHGAGSGPSPAAPPPVSVETKANFMRAGPAPANMMHMQFPGQKPPPNFGLVETRPPVAARMGYRGADKTATTYDLVERMHFLYVNVVKARDLPAMDITGSLDPYVEVRLGNYKGVTKHHEKNENPVWNQVFAFSKERLQSTMLEVVVKDKDLVTKDDFVGKIRFDVIDVPMRVPPDSPLAPQWYRLEDKYGMKVRGEIMLAVWMGTQADEAFPGAWHSDAHGVSPHNLANTRSNVYFSPKLFYLRIHVIEAQDLIPVDRSRQPEFYVKITLRNQLRTTRTSQGRGLNPSWQEELMFVASEPFDEFLVISVEDRLGPGKDICVGRTMVPVKKIPHRVDATKLLEAMWIDLGRPSEWEEEGEKKKEMRFSSKIHVRLCLEAGYHVLDEATHFSSDLQASSKHLRKPSIGILELGILSAQNLPPLKMREGKLTDAYCVAKYGNKWVRTRTLLNTLTPRWNEQYTWEVYDPCTVVTVGVFDNCHINDKEESRDQRIGKVRIRLSTLETDRIYTHYYPLLVLTPSGLKKHGELHLAIRFTCVAWVNMVAQYGRPLLPKMHYVQPISVKHIDWLRHQAMLIVASRLSRAEPPLKRENVEYMLDVDYHLFSLRRSKANFYRIMSLMSGITAVFRWLDGICMWRNPLTTILVHVLFLILVCYPELILPTIFLYLFVIGLWNYRFRPRNPSHMDARISQAEMVNPDELDEEFDSFPTQRPPEIVRMRYDRMRSIAGRVQTVVGDLATQGERAMALLSWRDSRATSIFIIIALVWAVFLYVTPFQVVAVLFGLYWLRHPRFRNRMPSVPVNFFKRLPAKSDMLL
ncbi:putative C2 domain, phosphoribosyltransferase, C2 domain superfamily [Helianthus annuus]|uniref:C2 domain, phosphoribosyltransferase, C2 domain superfamily n=1 Tax=Helianthus annuus TaxID=4232 RepID=A0A251UQV3_HELAN|nr:FT-interacting protein 7 [Helianthus annuus]KAF5806500.1 putative C2 domain, phosphoribosyltransferase, C2 domain superfamily [Helianthus annuus]KAJ0570764.1 putative C2 domain, phosphoribosyltransferase, C2 domain superfamily [Helianthus annuus]KAJ0577707.1 putative C2 domain, phosphoribosyltransferase, C2 domain superfamily [Helianthus annuus]KAJ0585105.1 putative C2 domain, phosphoribosyltransferase, C2 domain superfamily [Helianthus annuus]KAJ0747654.1 putative C2 domain, phosphoribosyl